MINRDKEDIGGLRKTDASMKESRRCYVFCIFVSIHLHLTITVKFQRRTAAKDSRLCQAQCFSTDILIVRMKLRISEWLDTLSLCRYCLIMMIVLITTHKYHKTKHSQSRSDVLTVMLRHRFFEKRMTSSM